MQLTKWEKQRLVTMLDTEIMQSSIHCGIEHDSTKKLKELQRKVLKEDVDGKRN